MLQYVIRNETNRKNRVITANNCNSFYLDKDNMIEYLKRIIIRNELLKLNTKTIDQFYDVVCNKYNGGKEFIKK